jgi:hypothetical protein
MIFSEIVTEAQRLAGRVDSNFDDRTKKWINQAQEQWSLADPWGQLTFFEDVLTRGGRDLYLPTYMRKVLHLFDKSSKLPMERHEQWDREEPGVYADETASSTPIWWREMGFSSVVGQPTTATGSKVEFDTLGAAEDIVCYISGVIQGTQASGSAVHRHMGSEFVTCMSGAGAQETSNIYVEVRQLSKTARTTDDVLCRYDASGDHIGRIESSRYNAEYRHVQLLYSPAAGRTLTVKYILRVPDFTDDNQPAHPGVDVDYLKWWTAANIHAAQNQLQESAIKRNVAKGMLQRKSHFEQAFGDQDLRMAPDSTYWHHEDLSAWP